MTEPTITKEQALEALDNMDDYARMTVGVDAVGPRNTLRAYIEAADAKVSDDEAEEDPQRYDETGEPIL